MKKAFTLLELVFVIAILGVIASMVTPRFVTDKNEAYAQVVKNQIAQVRAGLMAYANKQILAGKDNIYPESLEKNSDTNGKNRSILFNEILPNSTLKSNFQSWSGGKNGWSTNTKFKTRYLIFIGGNIIAMDYCSSKSAEAKCKSYQGQLICTSDENKCKIIGEKSY
ncbi:type II secretion system protein [Campylobacter hyointestinalis]|uniref:N-terminal methylation domain-containing protein n=1 Tax=Campylobacter hyointestinalis subsp. hyointestinalis TaxID=91352 RepID=A0A9W5EWJ8_CAMHY|nr:prepilin-type N-terminal cleavage/methylation domain-containing protein [Campylobacter hyointestinalis]CUU72085.1 N-terminal methylation domain-containing protein [Campylobacter hyointestinalis subsp. hyointestinalis]CUU80183.1 N-terminal methylation domain-containing protein [Campylobacter hyointestinalis subsp. hyointestinalis]